MSDAQNNNGNDQGNDQGVDIADAPGWAAIDRWVSAHFPHATPHQFASRTPYELDTASPLPAITVFETRAPAGWLYVSYGLSELFEKSSDDPGVSGFGFELTLRIPRAEGTGDEGGEPPVWPLKLFQALGHHALNTGGGFDSGHRLNLGAPLCPPSSDGPADCRLSALICLPDPALGKIDTINGSLLFLRLFGVTDDELAALTEVELGDLVACLAELEGLAITDPGRGSFFEDPEKSKILRRYKLGISL
ncbi:MAG: suppressor of fused domain protein [Myxococcales bacterium]|nr:suppressor of fused domain protein [Myxococcales bacterium]MCA9701975.1 suppressor of fused domain protein [Myxococcales bacterium]